jgi:acetolactate synthase regulatory subunit
MEEMYRITALAEAENVMRALQRIASLIARNRLKISQINLAGEFLSLALQTDADRAQRLLVQLRKMADLHDVKLVIKHNNNKRGEYEHNQVLSHR